MFELNMDIKKTAVLSVLLHICFFSAALLLSASLFEGSGKMPETDVVFISLSEDEPRVAKAVAVPERLRAVKKAEAPPVIAKKKPEISEAEFGVEKAEEVVPVTKESVSVEPFADESIGDVKDHGEDMKVAEAVHDTPAYSDQVSVSAGPGERFLPGASS